MGYVVRVRGKRHRASRCPRVDATTTPQELALYKELRKNDSRWLLHQRVEEYFPDLLHPTRRLIVEVDGKPHHTARVAWQDRLRTEKLNSLGYRVVRIDNERTEPSSLPKTVQAIEGLLKLPRLHPKPKFEPITAEEIAERQRQKLERQLLPWERKYIQDAPPPGGLKNWQPPK